MVSDQPESIQAEPAADPALQAEADAAIAGADPSALTETGAPPPDPVDAAEQFRKTLGFPVEILVRGVIPQWGIDDASKQELVESAAECLAQLFPDGVGGKYACWFRLINCTGFIVASAAVKNGGKLPIGPKREPVETLEHGTATPA